MIICIVYIKNGPKESLPVKPIKSFGKLPYVYFFFKKTS